MKKVLWGILIGVILCVGGLFGYKEFFVKNETTNKKITKTKEKVQKEEDLDLNSQLVQNLYEYVIAVPNENNDESINVDSNLYRKMNLFEEIEKKDKIGTSDLPQELKNYLGYRQLSSEQVQQKNCSNYPNISYNSQVSLLCGKEEDHDYNSATNTTKVRNGAMTSVINEEQLKEKVELIFGNNSYKEVEFFTTTCDLIDGYVYNKDSREYIYVSSDNGCGVNEYPTFKLIKATKKANKIYLFEKVDREKSEYSEAINSKIKYTFNLLKDGNYYFESAEKIN